MSAVARLLEREDVPATVSPSVREALAALGVRPFTAGSVARYKAVQVHRHRPPLWHRVLDTMDLAVELELVVNWLLVGFLACTIGGLIALLGVGARIVGTAVTADLAGATAAFGACGGMVMICVRGWFRKVQIKLPATWDLVELADWRLGMPLEVSLLIARIEGRIPGAHLLVDGLTQERTLLDPFLVLEHYGEYHYLAVWGEPNFDADAARASS